MAEGVLMPKAGITVEECVIGEWVKKVGDQVAVGDVLFTYETDKADFECESTAEGILLETFYEAGDEVPVLVNVCAIGVPGEDTSALKGTTAEAALDGADGIAEIRNKAAASEPEEKETEEETEPAERGKGNIEQKISPRARMAAAVLGVDAGMAAPTGPYGRIVEKDVRTLAENMPLSPDTQGSEEQKPLAAMQAAPADEPEYVDVKFTSVRKATARAMVTSLSTMAQLTHYHSFDATALLNLRKQIKANGETMGLPNITLNDMVMFAVAKVILNHSDLNAVIQQENVLRKYTNVHLGMAVDTPKGLMVPTIFHADKLTLAELCVEAKRLAKLCQEGKATMEMLSGGSFTVSNVGSLGVEMFTPVVNPPQVGILGVCGITTRVREVDGELKPYPAMGLCLSYDHRAIDGTPASKFMKELCIALENFTLLTMKGR